MVKGMDTVGCTIGGQYTLMSHELRTIRLHSTRYLYLMCGLKLLKDVFRFARVTVKNN